MPVVLIKAPITTNSSIVPVQLSRVSAGFPSPAGDDIEDGIDPLRGSCGIHRQPFGGGWKVTAFGMLAFEMATSLQLIAQVSDVSGVPFSLW